MNLTHEQRTLLIVRVQEFENALAGAEPQSSSHESATAFKWNNRQYYMWWALDREDSTGFYVGENRAKGDLLRKCHDQLLVEAIKYMPLVCDELLRAHKARNDEFEKIMNVIDTAWRPWVGVLKGETAKEQAVTRNPHAEFVDVQRMLFQALTDAGVLFPNACDVTLSVLLEDYRRSCDGAQTAVREAFFAALDARFPARMPETTTDDH